MKTAKKAGFKTKESGTGGKRQKYLVPTPPMARRVLSQNLDKDGSRPSSGTWDDELSGRKLRGILYTGKATLGCLNSDVDS